MAKRMLIDAAHPEETRVVVTNGTRLEEFDFESSTKKQVKGNIYLAKVTRVEPSLQATFVDYGGNRHGFLAFSEIHPDYYRIPVSDRPAGETEPPGAVGRPEDGDGDNGVPLAAALPEPVSVPRGIANEDEPGGDQDAAGEPDWGPGHSASAPVEAAPIEVEHQVGDSRYTLLAPDVAATDQPDDLPESSSFSAQSTQEPDSMALRAAEEALLAAEIGNLGETVRAVDESETENVETLGGDEVEEVEEADAERRRAQPSRHYKIQEVIKRRQIMLVQVAKEERGNKGAALTTYLSLAGRYCVLMPNTGRGGGVSRKITSIADRRRLKEILEDLEIPEGMGVIVRTAGAERSKAEIKRDYEYLLRLWNEIRDLTLKSTAPALIYEEGNLIKRSIRDLYTRDIDEVLVEGEEGYKTAKAFMRTLMPSHAKRVQPYRDPQVGLFHRFQVESQIDAIHSPVGQLRSGGYIVINQTEALVAIDVNSGRSTRERNIEETALRTNLEAADEIARQLRLRDLAGLIVIDFIDMEEHRNQGAVERRLKDAMRHDRARIQLGRISPFGLLEMSRQRLRPSLAEASTQPCPHCNGTGHIRSTESTALHVLRAIEEEGMRRRSAEITVAVPSSVALYILNQKRDTLVHAEHRYGFHVTISSDDALVPPAFRLERLRALTPVEIAALPVPTAPPLDAEDEDEDEETGDLDAEDAEEARAEDLPYHGGGAEALPATEPLERARGEHHEEGSEEPHGRRRRRRRRRGRRDREGASPPLAVPFTQPDAEEEM